jgi:hypothetical protein
MNTIFEASGLTAIDFSKEEWKKLFKRYFTSIMPGWKKENNEQELEFFRESSLVFLRYMDKKWDDI